MNTMTKLSGSEPADGMNWYDPQKVPQLLFSLNWFEQERLYRRLPKNWPEPFPESVEHLAWHTSGAQLRFLTDSRGLTLRIKLAAPPSMVHMPATGQCGFDCYLDEGQGLYFYSTTKYPDQNVDQTMPLFNFPEAQLRHVAINFPLYQGVEKVEIGVEEQTTVFDAWPYLFKERVVFYGTSITQGGCASRPGMSYTQIISNALGRSCINLGFSGSGRGEPVMANLIASMEDLAMIVLDYEANAGFEGLKKTLPAFLDTLRQAHPDLPVVVLSKPRFAQERFEPERRKERLASVAYQRQLVQKRRAQGDQALFFINGGGLQGRDFDLCSVDGVHPTDLGFLRMARNLTPQLRQILGNPG